MAVAAQERPVVTTPTPISRTMDRPVSQIISEVRAAPAPARGALLLLGLSAALLWASFYPLNIGPLAWLAPAPLLMLARVTQRTRWMYRCVYLGGTAYWIPTLQWMRLGDVSMIPAWLSLSLYLALYWPVFLAITRSAVHRLHVPLALAAPVVWVGLEYLRGWLMTGFSWYLLGHSQHEFHALVQICDLAGAYGVSFVMMLSAAALVETLPASWFARARLLPPVCDPATALRTAAPRTALLSVLASVLLVSSAVLYGSYRREQADFTIGPRVALIQGDFRSEVKHDPEQAERIYRTHFQMTGLSVPYRPDVIIWPETMFPYVMLLADPSLSEEQLTQQFPMTDPSAWRNPRADVPSALRDRAEQAGVPLIMGVVTQVAGPDGGHRYNSAAFVEPHVGLTDRYDKLHRVPFGEYIPLQSWLPFLAHASPYGSGTGIDAGEAVHVFRLGQWRLMPLICFEDTVPHLVGKMLRAAEAPRGDDPGQPVDCLVNLTNDGWFRNSSEQEQHLVTASFRCIETRMPMVRAVNTGISAVIDGDGVVRDAAAFIDFDRMQHPHGEGLPPVRDALRDPATGKYYKSLNAAIIADVPLDSRRSLYLQWGDWLAGGCLVLTLASIGWSWIARKTSVA